MTDGNSDSGSSKIKGYGAIAGVAVGLLTAIFTFGAEMLDRFGSDDPRSPTTSQSPTAPSTYSDYNMVTSEDGSLSMEIPLEWGSLTHESWYFPDASGEKVGPAIYASTNLNSWREATFEAPGASFVASELAKVLAIDDVGHLGTADGFFSSACAFRNERAELDRGAYSIKRDVWKGCGPKEAEVWNIIATPKDRAYVTMFEITILSDADREAADRILDTFKVKEDRLGPPPESQGDFAIP